MNRKHFFDYNPVEKIVDTLIERKTLGKRVRLTQVDANSWKFQLFRYKNGELREVVNETFPSESLRENLIVAWKLILNPNQNASLIMAKKYEKLVRSFPTDTWKCFYKGWRKEVKGNLIKR